MANAVIWGDPYVAFRAIVTPTAVAALAPPTNGKGQQTWANSITHILTATAAGECTSTGMGIGGRRRRAGPRRRPGSINSPSTHMYMPTRRTRRR